MITLTRLTALAKAMRRYRASAFAAALLGAVLFNLVGSPPAKADVPTLRVGPINFTVSGNMPPLSVSGQNTCGMTLGGPGTGSLTAYGSSDGGASYTNLSTTTPVTLATQSTNGTTGGAASPYATSNFYVAVTVSSGSVAVTEYCTAAAPVGSGGGGTSTVQCPTCPVPSPIPTMAGLVTPSPDPSFPYFLPGKSLLDFWNGTAYLQVSSSNPLPVLTAPPPNFPTPQPSAAPAATASPLPNGPTAVLCGGVGSGICKQPVYCDLMANVNGVTAATVAIGTVSAGQTLYICKWTAIAESASGSPYFQIQYSTSGSTCAGVTAATPTWPFPLVSPWPFYTENQAPTGAPLVQSSPGTTLCFHNGGTTPATYAQIWYTIF